jgi:NADH-quinone oxidoreductase subunit J
MNTLLDWCIVHRAQLVPLLLGFIAVYLLMPRAQPVLRRSAIVLGVLGAAGVLGFAIVPPGASLHGVLFYLFAAIAILAAASTVLQHNPVYSALSFALVTLSVCGLFLLRAAPFLAAATVIIYAGAIVVTFLFIIMLARQSGNAGYDRRAREPFLATLAAFILLGSLLLTIDEWASRRGDLSVSVDGTMLVAHGGFVPIHQKMAPFRVSSAAHDKSALRGLGRTLFTDYLIAVELAGTLLLIAGVGAVAIAPRRTTSNARLSVQARREEASAELSQPVSSFGGPGNP